MKDQMLKMAKVKSEKEFYKKYPSEEAFMKAHGKAFKKAAMGSKMVNNQLHQLTDFGNPPIAQDGATTPPKFEFTKPESFGAGAETAGMSALQNLDKIAGGIEAIRSQKKAKKKAEQNTQLSGLALQAQQTAQQPKRKYVRPEDSLVQPGQMGNPYGSGTNILQAENGRMIGGNPTEIQNMYNPGDMYTDLGFEPMGETLKQYRQGGDLPKAEFGEYFQDSGQAQIGSVVGESIGSAFGPAGAAVGKFLGKIGGNLLGGAKDARKLQAEQNKGAMNNAQLAFSQSNQLGAFRKNGGNVGDEYKWVSHTWQPQTITKFGEYNVKDLLKPPHDADMLRAGGHLKEYTPPSARALQTYEYGGQMAMGGDLEVIEGGKAETISYNPFLPDGGETVMFKGRSHDNGGIPINFGENGVEVEGGEPAVKLENGGEESNMVVFGNMKINKNIADLMGDSKAKGRKFKHYVADIAKNDKKQLKIIDKATEMINNADNNSAAGHLELITANLMKKGAESYQKINADKIQEAGIVQNAILDTASQLGVKSDRLAEGKLEKEYDKRMMAKFGTSMDIAQRGIKAPLFGRMLGVQDRPAYYNEVLQNQLMNAGMPNKDPEVTPFTKANMLAQGFKDTTDKPVANKSSSAKGKGKRKENSQVYVPPTAVNLTDNRQGNYEWTNPQSLSSPQSASSISSIEYDQSGGGLDNSPVGKVLPEFKGKGFDWNKAGNIGAALLSNLEPYLRPSNANEALPADQLYPEYFAMATNQLEPVQAQTFQPMLDTPMDISLNDQLNAIDSQSRAAIRAAGSNPAAQAMIMAQSLEAKNKVLGEQTRINAANKMQTYDKNRALLNDAKLKNLQILDQQYVRQAQAKSNTKAQTLEALKSIAAKTAQQRATNRKLAIMENMYGFRFSPSGRAINVNAPAQFNLSGNMSGTSKYSGMGLGANKRLTIDSVTGEPVGIRTLTKEEMAGSSPSMSEIDNFLDNKNGGKTPKTKARNSSIVKALKDL
jgi:hypothetical protein